jgi:predicted nucleic acid-binding protein
MIQYGGQLCTSQIVVAELYAWCCSTDDEIHRRHKRDSVVRLLKDVPPLPFDNECSWKFGELRNVFGAHEAESFDLMIAATALVRDLTVVSHDDDFLKMTIKVPELNVVDWL